MAAASVHGRPRNAFAGDGDAQAAQDPVILGGMTVVPRDSPFMGRSPGFPDRSPAGPSIYGLRIRLSTPAFVRKLTFNAMSVSALNGFVRGRMLGV
jgi:hypothetical protein